jgi:hypothetical protein
MGDLQEIPALVDEGVWSFILSPGAFFTGGMQRTREQFLLARQIRFAKEDIFDGVDVSDVGNGWVVDTATVNVAIRFEQQHLPGIEA